MANHTSLETGGPKFDVVLVSRTNNDQRPSPLEMTLRTQCRIMKVIEQKQKLNGAHFIFTKESGLAVRVYYPQDLQRMDEAILKERPSNAEEVYALLEQWNSGDENAANAKKQDIDGLRAFRKYFPFCFVIWIRPGEGGKAYLDRPDSILHRMQQIMCSFVDDPAVSMFAFILCRIFLSNSAFLFVQNNSPRTRLLVSSWSLIWSQQSRPCLLSRVRLK